MVCTLKLHLCLLLLFRMRCSVSGRAIDAEGGGGGGGRPSLNRPPSNNSMGSVTRGMSEVRVKRGWERGRSIKKNTRRKTGGGGCGRRPSFKNACVDTFTDPTRKQQPTERSGRRRAGVDHPLAVAHPRRHLVFSSAPTARSSQSAPTFVCPPSLQEGLLRCFRSDGFC